MGEWQKIWQSSAIESRQETTMVKHRALPDYVYQRELADSSMYVGQDQSTSEEKSSATVDSKEKMMTKLSMTKALMRRDRPLKNLMTKMTLSCQMRLTRVSNEIDKSATFLLGRIARYGRAVRFNSRLLF